MNATQVWERLFIGGIEDAKALAESNPLEIATVITLCREKVPKVASDVNYLHFPVAVTRRALAPEFDRIIDALWENIRWGKVLIHSLAGPNRAPIIVAARMHVVGCKSTDPALPEIGKLRQIEPNPNLLRSVKESL